MSLYPPIYEMGCFKSFSGLLFWFLTKGGKMSYWFSFIENSFFSLEISKKRKLCDGCWRMSTTSWKQEGWCPDVLFVWENSLQIEACIELDLVEFTNCKFEKSWWRIPGKKRTEEKSTLTLFSVEIFQWKIIFFPDWPPLTFSIFAKILEIIMRFLNKN